MRARLLGWCVVVSVLAAGGFLHSQETRPADAPRIPPPDPAAAEVPAGFRVEVAFDQLMYPSSIEISADGTIYVAECGHFPGDDSQPARILKMTGKGPAERQVVASDLNPPITDLLWHEGRLFVSHRGKISVLEGGKVRDLVTDLPSLGDHSNNQMAIGPDGKLYFGQGSATNAGVVGLDNFAFGWVNKHPDVAELPAKEIVLSEQQFETPDPRGGSEGGTVRTSAFHPFGKTSPPGTVVKGRTKSNGTILRMALDGSGLEVFAWGFRNPYGVQFGRDGRLYVADAGSDERGSRHIAHAPEKLFQAKQDAWYGWPDFEGAVPVSDPRYRPAKSAAPAFVMRNHPPVERPFLTFEEHASITQLDACPPGAFGFEGHLFLGASGDQSPVTAAAEIRTGYWVKRVDPATARSETFFRTRPEALGPKGLEYVTTAGPKRIVDVRFTRTGDALYVVDIGPAHYVRGPEGPKPVAFPGTGVIWRVTPSPKGAPTER
jgi:glucose/arabinose dehydrogenase